MPVQSILFPRGVFTEVHAKKWLQMHGYHATKVDITEHFLRFRQFDPIPGSRYYTKVLPNGVELVIAT